jgi:hypothetical protein
MSGLAGDIKLLRVSVPGEAHQPIAAPLGAAVTVYHGDVALLSSGTGATAGYLKATTTPTSTDTVIGMIDQSTGGTYAETGPGITGNGTDGGVWIDCATGSFLFQNGTGADALAEAQAGSTVYFQGSNANGPIAAKTTGSGTRPVLGTLLPIDPTIPAGYVPVKLAIGGP